MADGYNTSHRLIPFKLAQLRVRKKEKKEGETEIVKKRGANQTYTRCMPAPNQTFVPFYLISVVFGIKHLIFVVGFNF